MPKVPPVFRIPTALLLGGMGCLAGTGICHSQDEQDENEGLQPAAFESIEGRFFQLQDGNGYFWQAAENGALTSGDTQYLQSGLNLIVDGVPFRPSEGEMVAPSIEARDAGAISLTLREQRENFRLSRAMGFDPERGGVRVLDSLTNTDGEAKTVPVHLRTTYPFAWQGLYNENGQPLSRDPALRLAPEDHGVLIHFSPAEGRHDTLILCGAGDSPVRSRITASSNRREFTLEYELVIGPGETVSLLHWILQAGLQQVEGASALADTLFRNGDLVDPRLTPNEVRAVANFASTSFPGEPSGAARLRQLFALNDSLDRLGAQRRAADIVWIDSGSQMSGAISGGETILLEDIYRGETEIPLGRIAAIGKRPGEGHMLRVFLRDGSVLLGEVRRWELQFTPEGTEEARDLLPESYTLLLFKVENDDGVARAGVSGYLGLIDGAVLPVGKSDGFAFEFATSLGTEVFPPGEIREIQRLDSPIPHFRVVTAAGDRFAGFLSGESLPIEEPGKEPMKVPLAYVSRYTASDLMELSVDEQGNSWIDFSEIPGKWLPEKGFLLDSGSVRTGQFTDETFSWKQGDRIIQVDTRQIERLARAVGEPGLVFEATLRSGETLAGRPLRPLVAVTIGKNRKVIPVEKLYAYRSPTP